MLGSDYDITLGLAPVDLNTAGGTGLRQYMGDLDYLVVLFVGGAGAAAEPPVMTLKQHTAASGGTTADLATVTGTAQVQQMIAFRVNPEDLTGGSKYISVNVADVGAAAQLGVILYIVGGVSVKGAPTIMPIGLR